MAEQKNCPATVIIIALFALGLATLMALKIRDKAPDSQATVPAQFVLPELTALAQTGKTVFDINCAVCHGENALGTDQGPPLIHDIYQPGHHGDQSFRIAVKQGVRAHHWPHADMPPQPHVSDDDMTGIIGYIRELQHANGIVARAHQM